MSEFSLKDLMKQELDPKQVELRAKYTNAQIAVDMAYRYAGKVAYLRDTKVLNPEWKEDAGDKRPFESKYEYVDATSDAKIAELVRCARALKVEIEKDLNDTLKVLEGDKDGSESLAPTIP